jgi:hypothetical protein
MGLSCCIARRFLSYGRSTKPTEITVYIELLMGVNIRVIECSCTNCIKMNAYCWDNICQATCTQIIMSETTKWFYIKFRFGGFQSDAKQTWESFVASKTFCHSYLQHTCPYVTNSIRWYGLLHSYEEQNSDFMEECFDTTWKCCAITQPPSPPTAFLLFSVHWRNVWCGYGW